MSVRSAGRCARAGFLERRAIGYLGNVIVRPWSSTPSSTTPSRPTFRTASSSWCSSGARTPRV